MPSNSILGRQTIQRSRKAQKICRCLSLDFIEFVIFIRPKPDQCLLSTNYHSHSCLVDLTDVTLADEDGYSMLVVGLTWAILVGFNDG